MVLKNMQEGRQVVVDVRQRYLLAITYRRTPVCHMGVLSMAIGKYICAHYLQALNTFLDISNYTSTLFTDSEYRVNRRSGMDLERLGH